MNLKERIENNPFIYLIGVVVGAISITIAVDSFFWSKSFDLLKATHQMELDQYEGRLSSIERKINAERIIDLKSVVVSRTNQSRIPASSRFFPNWNFYAPKDDSYWVHEVVKEQEVALRSLSPDLGQNFIDKLRENKTYKDSPLVQLWSVREPHDIHFGPVRLLQNIVMKRISISDFLLKEKLDASYLGDLTDRVFIQSWKALEEQTEELSKLLKPIVNSPMPSIKKIEILSAEKYGDVFHVEGLITFKNIKVNGILHEHYYQRSEFLFISTSSHIFSIVAVGLGEDPAPRGKYYSKLTEWFSDLAILKD